MVSDIDLFQFATHCFRNYADKDYITARILYRHELIWQFRWSALQTIEKYLKAILLYNKEETQDLGHNLKKSLKRVKNIEYLEFDLPEKLEDFIERIQLCGSDRYLTISSYSNLYDLKNLDETVWSIRRYCQNLKVNNMLQANLQAIKSDKYKKEPYKYKPFNGYLEEILKKDENNLQRKALVWCNIFFEEPEKLDETYKAIASADTPPHLRYPKQYYRLAEYVKLPEDVKNFLKFYSEFYWFYENKDKSFCTNAIIDTIKIKNDQNEIDRLQKMNLDVLLSKTEQHHRKKIMKILKNEYGPIIWLSLTR